MSKSSTRTVAGVSLGWWSACINADNGAARNARARLRRAGTPSDVLACEVVHEFHHRLVDADLRHETLSDEYALKLAAMAATMAAIRENSKEPLAMKFGAVRGERRALSELRFQKLLRAEDHWKLSTALRRSLPIVGNAANVSRLGEDLFFWGEKTRNRWCFQYYGTPIPQVLKPESVTDDAEESLK
ncbi:MAG: type I-E CRISPR-associated protein Cse2/CasB [Gammaproteobacteria bacterium]|nr:MAG: type I-E CRISPR-associated protein Cse2/CasB [Gammaproteobacteria bacterium]